jgi:Transcriptional regulators
VFEQDVENVLRTERALTARQLEHCTELLSSARRIHVMGLRASFGLAHSLYFQLHQMLGNVTLSDFSRGETFEQMRGMGVQDVFVCFSFPRHTVLAVSAMKYARSLHSKCIAITDSPLSPIAADADLLLSVHTSILDISTSLVGGHSLIHAICAEVLLRNRNRAAENLKAVEESLKIANIHLP